MDWIGPPALAHAARPLANLLYRIQIAGTHPNEWRGVLEALNRQLNGYCTVLARYDFQTASGKLLFHAPTHIEVRSSYEEVSPTNPYFLARRDYAPGAVLIGSDTISDNDLIRTDYYRERLRPHRLFRRLTCVLASCEDSVMLVCIHRTREQPDFGHSEQQAVAEMLPYMALGLETQATVFNARAKLDALSLTALHMLPPLMIVDSDLRIVFVNSGNDALLGTDLLTRATDGRVRCIDPLCDRALRDEIGQCCSLGLKGEKDSRALTLKPTRKPPFELRLQYVGKGLSDLTLRKISLVCITHASAGDRRRFLHFSRTFKLTPAQARVSELVIGGMRPSRVALTLGISEDTVRTHLQHVFRKTGVHGQLDLLRLFRVSPTETNSTPHPFG